MMANRTNTLETQDVVVDDGNVLALREIDMRVTLGQVATLVFEFVRTKTMELAIVRRKSDRDESMLGGQCKAAIQWDD